MIKKGLLSIYNRVPVIRKLNRIEQKMDKLQHSVNALFKFETNGLELSPDREERIIAYDFNSAKVCHLARYEMTHKIIESGDCVLDIACGVGYGSRYIREKTGAKEVTGVDISKSAVEYATKVFGTQGLNYINASALDRELFKEGAFDKIVSFETIEHLEQDEDLISNLYYWLKPGGVLIGSVPNQKVIPFDKNTSPFHIRHYTPEQFSELFENAGFTVEDKYKQDGKVVAKLEDEKLSARNIVYIAKK